MESTISPTAASLKDQALRDLALLKRIFPAAFVIALICSLYVSRIAPVVHTVINITATGNTSADTNGSVVWLKKPDLVDLKSGDMAIWTSPSWATNKNILVSLGPKPSELQVSGNFRSNASVEFFKTNYSGQVELEINGMHKTIDLFQRNPGIEFIPLREYLGSQPVTRTPPFTKFFVTLLQSLFVWMLALILVRPIYLLIPEPSGVRTNSKMENYQPYLIGILSLLIVSLYVVAFYPGVMTDDSYEAYHQALSQNYNDWHPPIMAALWSITDKILPGAAGMFLLHLLMAGCSTFLLSELAWIKGKRFYLAPVLCLLLPQVSSVLFTIWKDISQAVAMLFAFSLWYFWKNTGRMSRARLILILVVLFYGATVRHNALPAAVPLIFILLLDYLPRYRAVAGTILMAFIFYGCNNFLNQAVFHTIESHTFQAMMTHDLMGVYKLTGKNYFPESYISQKQLDRMMPLFKHIDMDASLGKSAFLTTDAAKIGQLKRNWITAIVQQPLAYLTHRAMLFRYFLIRPYYWIQIYSLAVPENMQGMPLPLMQQTSLGKLHSRFVDWSAKYLFFAFAGITYVISSIVLMIISWWRRSVDSFALNLSSFLYLGTFFIAAPSPNYRYFYWSAIATLLSFYVLWMEHGPSVKPAPHPA